MTALRTRFIEDMQLHGYSPKTQSCYVGSVCGLAKHYHKSPDQISEEELRRYFLFLTLEKKVARATATIALCGIKFLFQNTLQRNWTCFKLLRPPREKKLPVVLSRQEVQTILPCVRTPIPRERRRIAKAETAFQGGEGFVTSRVPKFQRPKAKRGEALTLRRERDREDWISNVQCAQLPRTQAAPKVPPFPAAQVRFS